MQNNGLYILSAIVALCFIAAAVVLGLFAFGAGSGAALQVIVILIGLLGPTIAALVNLFVSQHNSSQIQAVQTAVNNHVDAHVNGATTPSA